MFFTLVALKDLLKAGIFTRVALTTKMNVPYPNCVSVAPVLTTLLAIYNGRCYPLNGPQAVGMPNPNAQNVSKPITQDSPYYNEQIYNRSIPITRKTVYFTENENSLVITQDMVPKDNTLHLIGIGSVRFNSITIDATRVNVSNIQADDFVWNTASKESACSHCGNIRLRASGRFFKCKETPSFDHVSATVMAPSCRIKFNNSVVTILRDKSSPQPLYFNTSITDFTVRMQTFVQTRSLLPHTLLCTQKLFKMS